MTKEKRDEVAKGFMSRVYQMKFWNRVKTAFIILKG
jgi:hypothetical protein